MREELRSPLPHPGGQQRLHRWRVGQNHLPQEQPSDHRARQSSFTHTGAKSISAKIPKRCVVLEVDLPTLLHFYKVIMHVLSVSLCKLVTIPCCYHFCTRTQNIPLTETVPLEDGGFIAVRKKQFALKSKNLLFLLIMTFFPCLVAFITIVKYIHVNVCFAAGLGRRLPKQPRSDRRGSHLRGAEEERHRVPHGRPGRLVAHPHAAEGGRGSGARSRPPSACKNVAVLNLVSVGVFPFPRAHQRWTQP